MPTSPKPSSVLAGLLVVGAVGAALFLWRSPSAPWSVSTRLFADRPARPLDFAGAFGTVRTGRVGFATEQERRGWAVEQVQGSRLLLESGMSFAEGSLVLDDPLAWLVHEFPVEATRVYEARVSADGWSHGDIVTFCWAGRDEQFVASRCAARNYVADDEGVVRFRLMDQRYWSADATKFKVQLTTNRSRELRLHEVELYDLAVPDLLAAEIEGEWSVELDRESRPARVMNAPGSFSVTAPLPDERARIQLGIAILAGVVRELPVEVSLTDERGTRVLFRETLEVAPRPERSWFDLDLAVRETAGSEATLTFQAGRPGGDPAVVAWSEPAVLEPEPEPVPNVLVLSLDTLAARRLSLYGYDRPTSPHLRSWGERRGVVFEQAVATAPWTLPSHVSILSGLSPLRHGVNRQGPVPGGVALLAESFQEAGYSTWASTAGALLHPSYGFDRGFDRYAIHGDTRSAESAREEPYRGFEELIAWLDERRGERFFAFFHTYAVHTPFDPAPEFRSAMVDPALPDAVVTERINLRTAPADEGFKGRFGFEAVRVDRDTGATTVDPVEADAAPLVGALYDAEIAELDALLGRLFSFLERSGLANETVVVVTSDHGESLLEYGGRAGHYHLHDDNLMVPLVIAAPGLEAGRVAAQVSSVDIVPTVLELAGLEPLSGIDGRSLVPLARGGALPARDAWAAALSTHRGVARRGPDGVKVIFESSMWAPPDAAMWRYDLRSDPGELAPEPLVDAAATEEFVERMGELPGLYVEGTNPSATPLRFSVVASDRLEAFHAPGASFSCCEREPGTVRVTVPANGRLRLVLPDPAAEWDAELRLEHEGAPARVHAILLDASFEPFAYARSAGGWTAVAADTTPPEGIRVWRVGQAAAGEGPSTEHLDRLRALGYIR